MMMRTINWPYFNRAMPSRQGMLLMNAMNSAQHRVATGASERVNTNKKDSKAACLCLIIIFGVIS